MRRYIAAALIVLLSGWNVFFVYGSLHDVADALKPHTLYLWLAFLHGLAAALGLLVTICALSKPRTFAALLLLWVSVNAVLICLQVAGFFSLEGLDGILGLLFAIPHLGVVPLCVALVSDRSMRDALGIAWPVAFLLMFGASLVIHGFVEPASHRIFHTASGRAVLELWLPTNRIFYLRPWSLAISLVLWTGATLRPIWNRSRM